MVEAGLYRVYPCDVTKSITSTVPGSTYVDEGLHEGMARHTDGSNKSRIMAGFHENLNPFRQKGMKVEKSTIGLDLLLIQKIFLQKEKRYFFVLNNQDGFM